MMNPKKETPITSPKMIEDEVKKKIKPEQVKMLDRIVLAGMKVMFGEKTHQMMLDQLDEKNPLQQNIGIGVAKLMILLFKQSKQTMPQELIIPAGGVLAAYACEFIERSGQDVTEHDLRQGMSIMTKLLLKEFGAPDDVIAKISGAQSQSSAQPPVNSQQQAKPAGGGLLEQQGG